MIFVFVLAMAGGTFAAGIWMVRRKREKLKIFLPLAVAGVLARVVLIYAQPLDARLFPVEAYPVVEWWWVVPFVFFLFGAGVGYVRSIWLRDALLVAEGMAFLYFGIMAWGESFANLEDLRGEVSARGACMQTTNYSCGAAACAAYLHSFGIQANEREMAYHCRTTPFFGTSLCGLVRGLSRKIPGGRDRVSTERLTIEQLAALGRPALVVVKSSIVNHWIVVDRVDDLEVSVRDPTSMAPGTMSRSKFEERWVGLAVWITLELPAAAPR
jgi:predicted double-glycine peptidase